jgi:hypothetical protein
MTINYARCTHKIKSRFAMAKAAFKKKTLFTSKLDLNVRMKLVMCYIWSITLYGTETWDTLESRSEIPGNFWNVMLEKYGDQLD